MIHHAKSILSAMALIIAIPSASVAQEIGKDSFIANCAVCHGVNGKGNGPIVDLLKSAPSDLTRISERNGGQFPIKRVYEVIADADQSRGHGTSEMPIWGNRFNADTIAQEGEYGTGGSGVPTAQSRVLELVFFLATIQEPT
ncbi:c-type cytochrome [Pseudohalocynthiibacter aestuariivivens]|jgi:mono/diheme cytochrome c family protein|uniref:C-type cytochrome n=1 Tax=Pseudohalocynthiibacter aestuariivivens TaxID=1591409 RepID=A0ABV5JLF6_9RHOB|nr:MULTISPECIES: cytochrome c [Pseudohalocynthiibacter]MBS9716751.1 cytochrome c [Pseudohalocynthiibacter aestuariivivens]MCK0102347.1 cytochrome c [Pseudohalocynthiibacter sp. F2068]